MRTSLPSDPPVHGGMTIGIEQYRARNLWLGHMLLQPFLGEVGDYSINRRGGTRNRQEI